MKKLFALILAIGVTFSMCSCTNSTDESSEDRKETSSKEEINSVKDNTEDKELEIIDSNYQRYDVFVNTPSDYKFSVYDQAICIETESLLKKSFIQTDFTSIEVDNSDSIQENDMTYYKSIDERFKSKQDFKNAFYQVYDASISFPNEDSLVMKDNKLYVNDSTLGKYAPVYFEATHIIEKTNDVITVNIRALQYSSAIFNSVINLTEQEFIDKYGEDAAHNISCYQYIDTPVKVKKQSDGTYRLLERMEWNYIN